MKGLENKVALVTGGSSGVGLGIAQRLAAEGATVVILGRTEQAPVDAAMDSDRIRYIVADLGNSDDLARVVKQVEADHGRLDILVNNAGAAPVTPFADMTMEEFDATFRVNTRAVAELTQLALPLLRRAKGSVVNISTAIVGRPMANMANYAASKAAMNMLTRV